MLGNPSIFTRVLIRFIDLIVLLLVVSIVLFHVFPLFNDSRHFITASILTYIVAAYLIFPLSVRLRGFMTRRKRIPRFTSSADGLPTDPVNIIVHGSFADLKKAYAKSGWVEADPLNFHNSIKMSLSFITNKPYPMAPFSNLYLFGRKQDIGFQKSIGGSPRKRHHVRYWALDNSKDRAGELSTEFWHGKANTSLKTATTWVGAGTRDTGFGLTKGTFQISHAVDKDTVKERDFMVSEIKKSNMVSKVELLQPDKQLITTRKINSFHREDRAALVHLK